MSRYGKYFLQHSLWLEDDFCDYYVQDDAWGRSEILDVEYVVFWWEEDAERWMVECASWDPVNTISRLRDFLAEDCLTQYMVHRMNDRQVIRKVADELCMNAARIVIKPKFGWAVRIDPEYREPVPPVAVEEAPDIDDMLDALQVELDALVAGQKRSYDEWEAKFAKMSDVEKAAVYGKKGGGELFDASIGAGVDMIKMSATQMWKVYTYPKRLADISAEAMLNGSWEPFQKEIHSKLSPLVRTTEQAKHFTSMAVVLIGEPATCDMLQNFAIRFWDNTHPVEKAQWGIEAGTELILNLLLLIFTAGVGTAANIAAKSGRLIKLAKLLERVAGVLKRVSSHTRLPKLRKGTAGGSSKPKVKTKSGAKGPEQPKTPEKGTGVDRKDKNGYGNDSDGPRTTDPKGARGPVSGRDFDPESSGGKILKLNTNKIKVAPKGIDVVEKHISRFGPDEANQVMVKRLRDIQAGKIKPTQTDLNFYSHELRESVRYRKLGWKAGQPSNADDAYDLWNNAHTATLEDYGLKEGPGVLYHPSAMGGQ